MKNNKQLITLIALIASMFAIVLESAAPKKPTAAKPTIQQSYAANARALPKEEFENLKKLKQCNTDWGNTAKKAKRKYRELVFEAATAFGHAHPEKIMLLNTKEGYAASGHCIIDGAEGRGIFIDQERLDKENYGSQRLTIYHETAHLALKHRTQIIHHCDQAKELLVTATKLTLPYTIETCGIGNCTKNKALIMEKYTQRMGPDLQNLRLKFEYEADNAAAYAAACEKCVRQEGEWYFKRCVDTTGLTLTQIKSMDVNQLTKHIQELKPQTIAYCKTGKDCHPLDLERALRFYRYAQCEGIHSKLCTHHKDELLSADKKNADRAREEAEHHNQVAFHKARRTAAREAAAEKAKQEADQHKK